VNIADPLPLAQELGSAFRKSHKRVCAAVQDGIGYSFEARKLRALMLSVNYDWNVLQQSGCSTPQGSNMGVGVDDIWGKAADQPAHLLEIREPRNTAAL
jgi:hypothetical protein